MKRILLLLLLLSALVLLLTSCDLLGDLLGNGTAAATTAAPTVTTAVTTTEPIPAVTTAPHTAHHYTATSYEATCHSDGIVEYVCACGDSYTERTASKTYRHEFSFEALGGGLSGEYVCEVCGLRAIRYAKACEWGDTDCYYYVTTEHAQGEGYEIVILGSGDMPDFGEYEAQPWDLYLPEAVSIVVADGVTSVGANAFRFFGYELDQRVTYSISDTVTRLAPNSLWMKTSSLTLGASVERIEEGALTGVKGSVYLPRSLTYLSPCADLIYYYEGSLDELYAIQTTYLANTVTLRERLEAYPEAVRRKFHFYVNASGLKDDEEYWR